MKSEKCVISASCENRINVIVADNWNGKGVGANEGQAEDGQIVYREIWREGGWMESEWANWISISEDVGDASRWPAVVAAVHQCTCHGMASLFSQNKVEEAENKKRQSQEQLDGITQQLSELQSTCSELRAKVQEQNAIFKSSEVSVGTKAVNLIKFHEVLRNTLIIVLFNYYYYFFFTSERLKSVLWIVQLTF